VLSNIERLAVVIRSHVTNGTRFTQLGTKRTPSTVVSAQVVVDVTRFVRTLRTSNRSLGPTKERLAFQPTTTKTRRPSRARQYHILLKHIRMYIYDGACATTRRNFRRNFLCARLYVNVISSREPLTVRNSTPAAFSTVFCFFDFALHDEQATRVEITF